MKPQNFLSHFRRDPLDKNSSKKCGAEHTVKENISGKEEILILFFLLRRRTIRRKGKEGWVGEGAFVQGDKQENVRHSDRLPTRQP